MTVTRLSSVCLNSVCLVILPPCLVSLHDDVHLPRRSFQRSFFVPDAVPYSGRVYRRVVGVTVLLADLFAVVEWAFGAA